MKWLWMIVALLWMAPHAWGATYYVSGGGHGDMPNDGNSCMTVQTITTPKLTWASFNTNCVPGLMPGDFVYIRGGTYVEEMPINGAHGSLSSYITISSYQNEIVTFMPNFVGHVLFPTNTSFVEVSGNVPSGIIFDCTHIGNTTCVDLNFAGNPVSTLDHFRLRQVDIANTWADLMLGGVPDNWPNCTNYIRGQNPSNPNWPANANGINSGAATNTEVIGVKAYHSAAHGGYVGSTGLVMTGVEFFDNCGFGAQKYPAGDNVTVRNSSFHGNLYGGGLVGENGTGTLFYNIVSYDNGGPGIDIADNNAQVYNNTMHHNNLQDGGGGQLRLRAQSTTAINNISWGSAGTNILLVGTATLLKNLCGGSGGTGNCSNSSGTFPFVSTSDFHLVPSSPAMDIGNNLMGTIANTDKDGVLRGSPPGQMGVWDVGAYEFTNGTGPPPVDLVPVEDFVYTAGSNLSGLNCSNGSIHCDNWTGPWITVSGTVTVDVAPSGSFSGGNAAHSSTPGTQNYYTRNIGAFTTGSIQAQMRSSVTTGVMAFGLTDNGGSNLVDVQFYTDGHLHACVLTASDTDLGAYTANTYYNVVMQLDKAGHANQARVSINNGTSFSAWFNYCDAAAGAQGTKIYTYDQTSGTHDFWLDSIGFHATSLAFTAQPPATVNSGATFAATAAVTYSDGATVVANATNSITLSNCLSSPAAMLSAASGLTKAAVAGSAAWTDLVETQAAGAVGLTLCASATGLVGGESTSFNINAAQPPIVAGGRARIRARSR